MKPYISDEVYESRKHAIYKGFCPYGHTEAFYLDVKNKKLIKANFQGNKLFKIEFDWEKAAQVTTMKVHNTYLMVGHLDGSVKIFDP